MRAHRTVIKNNGISDPNQFFTTLLTKCALLCSRPHAYTSLESRGTTFRSDLTGCGVCAAVRALWGRAPIVWCAIPGLGTAWAHHLPLE